MPTGVYLRKSIEERLLSRRQIDPRTGCWIWTGARDQKGRGNIVYKGKCELVSRVAAFVWLGLEDRTQQVLHDCDNPKCFNPQHLHPGNQSQNLIECVERGRNWQTKKTHCPQGHPLTAGNIYTQIRNGRRGGFCRTCAITRATARNKRLKMIVQRISI